MIDTTEKRFESDIETFLLSSAGGYTTLPSSDYDKQKGLFFNTLIEFVKHTQPKQWTRHCANYANPETAFYTAFDRTVNEQGLLSVLRNGFADRGVRFAVVYFAPTHTMNPDLVEKYNANTISVTRQFYYSNENNNSVDMVLSVNGIPLVALELKNQLTGQNVENAKRQLMTNRNPREICFGFNRRILVYFAVDTFDAFMTTQLQEENTHFLPFNQGSNGAGNVGSKGNPQNPDGYATAYLWERILQKDNLLLLLQRYINLHKSTHTEIKNGRKSRKTSLKLIFPRFHQFDVVEKIVGDCLLHGSGKNYLIQHSAGSGKSNSIAWLTYKLATLYNHQNQLLFSSVIIVTDRRVLDKQLQNTISSFDHTAGLVECIDDSKTSQDLKNAINDGKKIIITTLQKFPVIFDQVKNTEGKNYAIIVDEAHSSQTGNSARKLKTALANKEQAKAEYAEIESDFDEQDQIVQELLSQGQHKNLSFFAFTATPKAKTIDMFGVKQTDGTARPFHIYSMRQAIDEGFILDVLKNYTTIEQYFKIAKKTPENEEYEETPATRAILKYYKSHNKTVEKIVELVVEKFRELTLTKINGKAKAMVVCESRVAAVQFYEAIKKYVGKKRYADVNVLVAFSGEVEYAGKTCQESKLNTAHNGKQISEKALPEYFAGDEFNALVVADKYQTGFDEPKLHTMFILKKLSGVKAVQTLSRVNRTTTGKHDTFVMDFVNTAEEIQNAFQPFYEETILTGEFDVNSLYTTLSKIKEYNLFNADDVNKFVKIRDKKTQSATDAGKISSFLKPVVNRFEDLPEEQEIEYKQLIKSFVRFYAYISQIIRLFDANLHKHFLFLEYLARLLPKFKMTNVLLDDEKIALEYISHKESFSGDIELKKDEPGTIEPKGDKAGGGKQAKIDLLQNIINKINTSYDGKFDENDRVIVETIYNKILTEDNKQLKRMAKSNSEMMFVDANFPEFFMKVAMECYEKHNGAFEKIFNDTKFKEVVMKEIGNQLYNKLRQ